MAAGGRGSGSACRSPLASAAVIGFQLLVFLILLSVVAVVWLVTRDKR